MNIRDIQKNNSKYRIELTNKATETELIFKEFLESRGEKFIFQKGFLKPYHRICDFYIKKYRLIVEIDGGYHKDTVQQDINKDFVWSRFDTLRITNEQVLDGSYVEIFNSLIQE